MANDENVCWYFSLVDTVGGEDEAERHERTHHTGRGNIAPPCDVVGGLFRARRERRLRAEREPDEDEEREQQPAHAISV